MRYSPNVGEQVFSDVEMQESEYFRPKWTGIKQLPPTHAMRLKHLVILKYGYSRICIKVRPAGYKKTPPRGESPLQPRVGVSLEGVMNSIRKGLGMGKTEIAKEPSRPWNSHFYAVFAQVHNTL
jgi:hypothetical protein